MRFAVQTRNPPVWSPAGLVLLDLVGRLRQAMQVRRHGISMMMVVAVMAEALHQSQN
jgi:hypothetical protein